jgi:hypothetical protein
MKNFRHILIGGAFLTSTLLFAGNEDRVGSAGSSELLVNPWARSAAMGDASVASSSGVEATFTNIAGLASTVKTQMKFNYSNWMGSASGIGFSSAGLAQALKDSSYFCVSIQSMNFGDIPITTVANPNGQIGNFSPKINVFNIGYARHFSKTISGGINFKVISESMSNMKGTGIAVDAGVKYVTGKQEQVKFGVALKNVGPTMNYKGDGFNQQVFYSETGEIATLNQRVQDFELPALLNIGASYDFIFDEKNVLTTALAFTANSFSYDQYRVGLNYGLTKESMAFHLLAGFVYEKNLFSSANRSNALTGPSAGFTYDAFVGKSRSALGIEYTARIAGAFGVIHTLGATISIK